ncbi:MAG: GNAT family N-acetyltransferase [Planctomycetaceae bacterium]
MEVVSAARGRWRDQALKLFIAGQPETRADSVAAGDLDDLELEGLLAAVSGDRVIGATLFVVQPDRTGHVWPPVLAGDIASSPSVESAPKCSGRNTPADAPALVADALLADVARRLDAAGAWLGQSVVDVDRLADRAHLERNGFGHLANLVLMERSLELPLPDRREGSVPATRAAGYDPGRDDARIAALLGRTYEGTLDCPGLDRWRSPAEALASHRLAGEFDPDLWVIHRDSRGNDVGLLLATAHPAESAREVVYMGVVPEARGRGFGRAMLLDALGAARSARCAALRLAVDERNAPARTLYDACGFAPIGTRCVHGRPRGGGPFRA